MSNFGYNVLGFGAFPSRGAPIDITYLVIAGAGGGGKQGGAVGMSGAGGGGAGGHVTGTATVEPGATTITVGAGGAGITGNSSTQGNDGVSSTIAGVSTSSVVFESRAPVGSSARSKEGLLIIALAIATRCC